METQVTTHFSRMAITGIAASLCAPALAEAPPERGWEPIWTTHAFYRPANLFTEILAVGTYRLYPDPLDHYVPRTELGRRLLALRRTYVQGGGRLLSWDEIDAEVRLRRGGVTDA